MSFSVATFVAFGLGTTIAVFLFGALLPRGAGGAFDVVAGGAAASLVFGIFLAPLLAVVTGLTAPLGQSADGGAVAVSTGAGAAAGFVVMVVVQFLLVLVLSGEGSGPGGSGGGLGQILLPALGFTVGVGLTGAAAGYIGAEF